MLSEEKIKKMIHLSDYENGFGSVDFLRTHYIKMDYVRLQALKTAIAVTVAGCLAALLFLLYHADVILYQAAAFPLKTCLVAGGGIWLFFLVAGILITCIQSSRLYEESKSRVKEYDTTLHELLELYEKEEQGQEEELT